MAWFVDGEEGDGGEDGAGGGYEEVEHGVVDAGRGEFLHVLAEEFVAEKFEEFPEDSDGDAKADDKEDLKRFFGGVGAEKFEGVAGNDDDEDTRDEVSGFVKEGDTLVKVEVDAEEEGDEEEGEVDELEGERDLSFEDEGNDVWEEGEKERGDDATGFVESGS